MTNVQCHFSMTYNQYWECPSLKPLQTQPLTIFSFKTQTISFKWPQDSHGCYTQIKQSNWEKRHRVGFEGHLKIKHSVTGHISVRAKLPAYDAFCFCNFAGSLAFALWRDIHLTCWEEEEEEEEEDLQHHPICHMFPSYKSKRPLV